jgi:hypothetical protein
MDSRVREVAAPGRDLIDRVKAFLELRGVLGQAVIANRLKSERYVVVWPENYVGGFEL